MCFATLAKVLLSILLSQFNLASIPVADIFASCPDSQANYLPTAQNVWQVEPLRDIFEPEILGERAAVLDPLSNAFLYEKDGDGVQPLASITKLLTALVFLDNNPGWQTIYKIKAEDKVEGGRISLFLGDEVRVEDLFYTSLVASDNVATIALVRSTGLSQEEFIAQMNVKARQLGLFKSSFADPVGLSDRNVSTAKDIARLAVRALENEDILKATLTEVYEFETLQGRQKKIESTDYLLGSDLGDDIIIAGGKTGYTERAGYCFVGRFKNKEGREIISVVLDSPSKAARFTDSKDLADWAFSSHRFFR